VSKPTVADDTAELIAQIKALAIVRGSVVLASGRTADYYVDMRRVTLDGAVAPIIGRVMRALVADWEFEAVGGLTLGADPVATAMMHAAAAAGGRLDAFVVRKQGKAHGLQQRIEGSPVAGRRVLAVEDTSTTGGSVLTAVEALRNAFRHAQAPRIEVELHYDNEQFRLRVRDDGRGIDRAALSGQGSEGHYGLPGLRERAALIGGKLEVWSEVDSGTEVELRVPASTAYAATRRSSWWSRMLARKAKA
jgi:orotate phosphoribosyltransferase